MSIRIALIISCIGDVRDSKWRVLAVGLFADNPYPLDTTSGRSGLFKGGGWYLLGVQTLACVCLTTWGIISSVVLLWAINKVVTIRMGVHEELLGADLTEHFVKHGHVGVSRALSALRPVLDTSQIENLDDVGGNPGHLKHLEMVKELAVKKKYKLSRILRDLTKNRNMGINIARNLFPKKKKKKSAVKPTNAEVIDGMGEHIKASAQMYGHTANTTNLAWID